MLNSTVIFLATEPDSPERLKALMPDFRPAGNIKDEAKKIADVQDKQKSWLENAHLNPLTGKIAGYGWHTGDAYGFSYAGDTLGVPITEEQLLIKIGDTLMNTDGFLTFDGRGYDYPWLASRSMLYESTQKYTGAFKEPIKDESHFTIVDDVAEYGLTPYQSSNPWAKVRESFSLRELAAFFEIPYSPTIHFHRALADYRQAGVGLKYEATFDNPSGDVTTEAQKQIHAIMSKHLTDQVTTIYNLFKKFGYELP